jgi:cell wall-associated NlpC family hydrolase
MIKRIYVMVLSVALLVATPAVASADPSTWTGGTHQQAINFVIQRALSQRGVPFVYGGGGVNGPSLAPAGVSQSLPSQAMATVAPGMTQQLPQVGAQATGALPVAAPQTAAPSNSLLPALAGLFAPTAATAAVTPAPTTPGFDASGLVQYAFAGVGIKLPRSSGEQYKVGRKVTADQALPGDLIFYGPAGAQSVALFIGNGQMIEGTEPTVTVSQVRTNGMDPYLSRIIEWQ